MATNLFPNPSFDNSFMGNSFKPIAGIALYNSFNPNLVQVRISDAEIAIGSPVEVTNKFTESTAVNAGTDLAPNVFNSKAPAAQVDGFLVMSENALLEDGDAFPKFVKNQIVYCALLGSGAEVYLPADNALIGKNLVGVQLSWNKAEAKIKAEAGDGSTKFELKGVTIKSQVVEGVVSYIEGGVVKTKTAPVVKIKL